jgi:hypothetical protein
LIACLVCRCPVQLITQLPEATPWPWIGPPRRKTITAGFVRRPWVRAGGLRMRFRCEPSLPVDVIGLFVLLPAPQL